MVAGLEWSETTTKDRQLFKFLFYNIFMEWLYRLKFYSTKHKSAESEPKKLTLRLYVILELNLIADRNSLNSRGVVKKWLFPLMPVLSSLTCGHQPNGSPPGVAFYFYLNLVWIIFYSGSSEWNREDFWTCKNTATGGPWCRYLLIIQLNSVKPLWPLLQDVFS